MAGQRRLPSALQCPLIRLTRGTAIGALRRPSPRASQAPAGHCAAAWVAPTSGATFMLLRGTRGFTGGDHHCSGSGAQRSTLGGDRDAQHHIWDFRRRARCCSVSPNVAVMCFSEWPRSPPFQPIPVANVGWFGLDVMADALLAACWPCRTPTRLKFWTRIARRTQSLGAWHRCVVSEYSNYILFECCDPG